MSELLTDSLGRRKRTTPHSTGRRVIPTPRHLLMMEKLHRHGPLPSSFLVEYASRAYKSPKNSLEALTHLFNEDNTFHGRRYLDRPWQQFQTFDARYQELMYDVLPVAHLALEDAGRLFQNTPVTSTLSWKHDAFCSATTASIELAILNEPEKYEYIFHDEIVSRIGHVVFPMGDTTLRPDRAFGIKYKATGGVRLFLIEADCATEPDVSKAKRKTHTRALEHYKAFIGEGEYKKYFGQGTRLMLLYLFSSKRKMENVIEMAGNNTYILFQSWPTFARHFIPPKPRHDLFTGSYFRAGHPPFFINQV